MHAKGTMADDSVKVADEDLALEIVMMAGCGLRNGEARAATSAKAWSGAG
ncbi:hypothetical protein [Streptomyces wedmorensis]